MAVYLQPGFDPSAPSKTTQVTILVSEFCLLSSQFVVSSTQRLNAYGDWDFFGLNIPRLVSGNQLETLELYECRTECGHKYLDHFQHTFDFMFPIPDKVTGIHHFSGLRCLKVQGTFPLVQCAIIGKVTPWNDEKSFNRTQIAYPKLHALVFGGSSFFGQYLLAARAPHLKSLHLFGVRVPLDKDYSFEELSELCLCGLAYMAQWLHAIFKSKSKKGSKPIDKIFLDVGEVNLKDKQVEGGSLLGRGVELVLSRLSLSHSKYIRLKMTIGKVSFREIIDQVVSSLEKSKVPFEKFRSISFHLEIVARIPLGKDLSMCIPTLLFWLRKLSKHFAFSVSVKKSWSHLSRHHFDIVKHLLPFVDESENTVWKRSKSHEHISLVICSKHWGYCVGSDKWNVDCEQCELDLHGWEEGGSLWCSS